VRTRRVGERNNLSGARGTTDRRWRFASLQPGQTHSGCVERRHGIGRSSACDT